MGTVHTFPYDETPTPTRFIRNCDEVGLFQDLQHNPFDETFRIAVASSDIPQLLKDPVSKTITEETLNTPRVIPSSNNDNFNDICPIMEDDEDVIILSNEYLINPNLPIENHSSRCENVTSDRSSDIKIVGETKQTKFISEKKNTNSFEVPDINQENVFFALHDPNLKNSTIEGFLFESTATHSNAKSSKECVNKGFTIQKSVVTNIKENAEKKNITNLSDAKSLPKTMNTTKTSEFLYKLSGGNLPAVISGKNVVILPSRTISNSVDQSQSIKIVPKQSKINNSIQSNVKQKLKSMLNNNSSHNGTNTRIEDVRLESQNDTNSTSSIEDEKREYSRERNRMAQKRCRMKKKKWIMQLKKETEFVLSKNQNMQVEINSLRAEIAHLKTLLLAHRNCSKQVNNQVSNVNHIHVHVPQSSQPVNETLSFIPNQKPSPINFPHRFNVINSNSSQSRRFITDSKVVSVKPNDKSFNDHYQNRDLPLKTSVLTVRNIQNTNKTIPEANKKPNLKLYINSNQATVTRITPINDVQILSIDES
ncbi:hypothetical protein PGB90_009123 [Kerria lacca]